MNSKNIHPLYQKIFDLDSPTAEKLLKGVLPEEINSNLFCKLHAEYLERIEKNQTLKDFHYPETLVPSFESFTIICDQYLCDKSSQAYINDIAEYVEAILVDKSVYDEFYALVLDKFPQLAEHIYEVSPTQNEFYKNLTSFSWYYNAELITFISLGKSNKIYRSKYFMATARSYQLYNYQELSIAFK
jgi:hypothetical protein